MNIYCICLISVPYQCMQIYPVHSTKSKVSKIFIVVCLYDPFLFLFGSIYMMKELHIGTLRYTIFIVCDGLHVSTFRGLAIHNCLYIFQPENILLSTEENETLIKVCLFLFVCVFKGPLSRWSKFIDFNWYITCFVLIFVYWNR